MWSPSLEKSLKKLSFIAFFQIFWSVIRFRELTAFSQLLFPTITRKIPRRCTSFVFLLAKWFQRVDPLDGSESRPEWMAIDLNTNPIASSDPSFCLEHGADIHRKERTGDGARENGRRGRMRGEIADRREREREGRRNASGEAKRIECLPGI